MDINYSVNTGQLEIITGSMFSGKSEELIRRLRRAKYAKQNVIVFKHSIDKRYGEKGVFTHSNHSIEAYSVSNVKEIEEIMDKYFDSQVIGIDEAQFFGEEIVDFCKKYVEKGKRIVLAGLDLSFRAEPYYPMPELLAIADKVDKLHAICTVCGKPAYASQRLINGEPAYYEDPLVLVGASENYEARCRNHHIVRYKNKENKIVFIVGTESGSGKKVVEEHVAQKYGSNVKNMVITDYLIKNDFENLLEIKKILNNYLNDGHTVIVRIVGSIFNKIERNYKILDLLTEYRKKSEIIIVSKYKKGIVNQVLLMINTLTKADLNIKCVVYVKGKTSKSIEEISILDKLEKEYKIPYKIEENK